MLAASYSKRDHVLALTEMQARETGGQVSKNTQEHKKVQCNRNKATVRWGKQGKQHRVKGDKTNTRLIKAM